MRLATLVVMREALLHRITRECSGHAATVAGKHRCGLEHRKCASCVTVRFHYNQLDRVVIDVQSKLAQPAIVVGRRAADQLAEVVDRYRLQHEHSHSRQQSTVHLERRILSGRADESYGSAFDMRQKRVLLCLVEAMNLIDEQDRLAPKLQSLLGCSDDLANSRNALGNCREGNELTVRISR